MLQDEPLKQFIMLAEDIVQANFAPTLLGLASMMLMTWYQHFFDILGHFNTPWLYGECMTGKHWRQHALPTSLGVPETKLSAGLFRCIVLFPTANSNKVLYY